jgi:signal recognition particle receptor subunit beta
MQQQLEVWKEQASHMWNVANDYLREVPPNQLYAAAAIALFTTLLLLLCE